MRELEVEAAETQATPPALQALPETVDQIRPGVPLLVVEAGQVNEEILEAMDDAGVVEVHDAEGDQGADGEADGRTGGSRDHDTGNAAQDGGQDRLDGFEELLFVQLAVPVEGEVVRQDAEDQTEGHAEGKAQRTGGEAAERAADCSAEGTAAEGGESGDQRGHDLFPVDVQPVEENILQLELKGEVPGEGIVILGGSGSGFRSGGLWGGGFGGGRRSGASGGTAGGGLRLLLLHLVSNEAVDLVELEELLGGLPDCAGEMLVLAVEVTEGLGSFVILFGIRESFKDDRFESGHAGPPKESIALG